MSAQKYQKAINKIRRRDRAVEDENWIRSFLRASPVGVLATASDGQPYLHTSLYVYDEEKHAVYFHGAREGHTRACVDQDNRVCFTASSIGRILPAKTALEFGLEYASVILFGRAVVVEDDGEKRRGLELLMEKYAPHLEPERDYRPPNQKEVDITAVFRIDIESWSGKKAEAEPGFPGAYRYEEHSR
jgi:nitroimidazol reductase NimA-like FMN-containing flavoprotein (pyridoxamine 5'-phosphate oxidase superfamily)